MKLKDKAIILMISVTLLCPYPLSSAQIPCKSKLIRNACFNKYPAVVIKKPIIYKRNIIYSCPHQCANPWISKRFHSHKQCLDTCRVYLRYTAM